MPAIAILGAMTQTMRTVLITGALILILGGLYVTRDSWATGPSTPPPSTASTTEPVVATTPTAIEATNGSVTLAIGQTGTAGGLTIVPHEILGDSRCPGDVECVWAGEVRIKVAFASSLGALDTVLSVGQAATTTSGERITLTAVTPTKTTATSIIPVADYRFTFEVVKP